MHHLTAAGVSFVLGSDARGVAVVQHWGAALPADAIDDLALTAAAGAMHSALDEPAGPSVAASGADGWSGTPAFEWHAAGVLPAAFSGSITAQGDDTLVAELSEPRTGGAIRLEYRLLRGGVLAASATLRNEGTSTLDVGALRLLLPLPERAAEILDFTGAWSGERRPQRRAVQDGTWDRSNRRGRTGHDAATLTVVGTTGFGYRHGEVWSTHLAWSGNGQVLVERLPEGAGPAASLLGAGELLLPGEVRLEPGASYASPTAYFSYAPDGMDTVSRGLHDLVRSFPNRPTRPRPLLLNSWEAVYFDHDLGRLRELAEAAAAVGVERFVLDDGWFLGRRDDRAGLGDWTVDPEVWPNGLTPLSDIAHGLGMEFGLWFEPEMVNPDSDLARTHPEWILADAAGAQPLWRSQQVLNLGDPDCWQHIYDRIDTVVGDAGVDFIKWDHNRDLHEAVDRGSGGAGVHRQTSAVYRMLDALQTAHPGLEIESCASGGARVDLGMAQHTQRVWASDTIDPLERHMIQLGTELLLPLEQLGTHVGAARAHTTGRSTSLSFRLATALFGHAGIEQDVARLDAQGLAALTAWADLYKQQRDLMHSGDVVHADHAPAGAAIRGVVSRDRTRALFQFTQLVNARPAADPRSSLPGLDPQRRYRVRFREEFGRAARRGHADPAWCLPLADGGSVVLAGAILTGPGVPLPALQPAEALIIEAVAAD